jgi:carbonic anhydrase
MTHVNEKDATKKRERNSAMSTPMLSWQRLRAGNEKVFVPGWQRRAGLVEERPAAAVFRCADAAVASATVFGQDCGSLVDISTWGHVIDSGVLATLDYAVEELRVPLIVVLGHQECRAMRTAVRAWENADIPIGSTRVMVEHAIGSIVRRGLTAESVETVCAAHTVETGLALLERSPAIARGVEAGKCGIVCATIDAADGRIIPHATVGPVGEVADGLLECV